MGVLPFGKVELGHDEGREVEKFCEAGNYIDDEPEVDTLTQFSLLAHFVRSSP
jgi:hypothetical protein